MDELSELASKGLLRQLRPCSAPTVREIVMGGRRLLNFSSNDYLGLSHHPLLIDAAHDALQKYGTGATASRLVTGSRQIFHELEDFIADSKHTEAALSFASGYATAMGSIPALVGKGDTVILDKLSHACLIDAARLSGATLRVFPHNDLNKLERLLQTAKGRVLVTTESVFSMDGDHAPLREICQLKNKYGAELLLDEAHALGVLGPEGQGLAEELGLQDQVDFQMGTLGKAVGSAGGYLAATRKQIDLLINKARSFIYSTAPPPSQAAASLAGLKLIRSEEGRQLRDQLQSHIETFDANSAIIPIIIGENDATLAASERLLEAGFLVYAIRYPTVARGTARLRVTLNAKHQKEDLAQLKDLLTL